MEPVSIGAAARIMGLSPSTLRYYEERELVTPARTSGGARVYGQEELRRLGFLQLIHRLGLPLALAGAILDEPATQWRAAANDHIAELDRLIALARGAQAFLRQAVDCPHGHPMSECPDMRGALDQLLDGTSLEELAEQHNQAVQRNGSGEHLSVGDEPLPERTAGVTGEQLDGRGDRLRRADPRGPVSE